MYFSGEKIDRFHPFLREFCDSENGTKEKKVMEAGRASLTHQYRREEDAARPKPESGASGQIAHGSNPEFQEVFKHFQPQHPLFTQNLT